MPALTVLTHLGYDIREDGSDLWDWGVGLSAFVGDLEVSLLYEDTTINNPQGSGTVTFWNAVVFLKAILPDFLPDSLHG